MIRPGRPAHRHLLAFLALAALAGCAEITGNDVICTADIRASLVVRITDAVTGAPLAAGATVVVREGRFQEVLKRRGSIRVGDTMVAVPQVGVDERPVTYSVEVAHAGYATVVVSGVRVTADECHVSTREVEVRLNPL